MDEKEHYEIEDTRSPENVSSVETINSLESTEKTLLEWIPAYYCEMTVMKSNIIDEAFSREVYERLYKQKGHLWWKKLKIHTEQKAQIRYNLSEIRSSPLRAKMQIFLTNLGFECKLPNNHVRYGKKQNCLKKMITEKISFDSNYANNIGPIVDKILVREHERVLIIENGKMMKDLPAGLWNFLDYYSPSKLLDIYYFDIGNIHTRWGTSITMIDGRGSASQTPIKLRINGDIIIRINDPQKFLSNLVKNENEFYEGNLDEYFKPQILQIINSELSMIDPFKFYQDIEKINELVKIKVNLFFQKIGIEIVDFSFSNLNWDKQTEEIFHKRLEVIKVGGASLDHSQDLELDKLKKLKELGVDITQYLTMQHQAEIAKIQTNTNINLIEQNKDEYNPTVQDKLINKVCKYCGSPSGEGTFCQNCGKQEVEKKICPYCGESPGLGVYCQNCRGEL